MKFNYSINIPTVDLMFKVRLIIKLDINFGIYCQRSRNKIKILKLKFKQTY